MWRLFAIATVCGISLSLSACSNGDTKKDGKKKDDQAAAKKDDKHKDGDHEHGKEGKHNDEDDHSPSDEPLVIVDDVVAASDGHAKEIFANDHARVVAVELHKGESLPLHKGGPRVVYAETALKFKFIEVHGDHTHAHADDHAAGTVHSHGAGPHGVENLADGDAKFVIFLRKEGDKKFTASVPEDAKTLSESTEHATKLLSNDDFRVIKVELKSGQKTEKHFALNRLIYALSDGTVTYTEADDKKDEHKLVTGETTFHEAGMRAVENTGDGDITFLVIEMKR